MYFFRVIYKFLLHFCRHNKLAMDSSEGRQIDEIRFFTKIRSEPLQDAHVVSVSSGKSHTVILNGMYFTCLHIWFKLLNFLSTFISFSYFLVFFYQHFITSKLVSDYCPVFFMHIIKYHSIFFLFL